MVIETAAMKDGTAYRITGETAGEVLLAIDMIEDAQPGSVAMMFSIPRELAPGQFQSTGIVSPL